MTKTTDPATKLGDSPESWDRDHVVRRLTGSKPDRDGRVLAARADQGTRDGETWARNYATRDELVRVAARAKLEVERAERFEENRRERDRCDPDERYLASLDEEHEKAVRERKSYVNATLDGASPTLASFLRGLSTFGFDRLNRPFLIPGAVTVDEADAYWTGFQHPGGFFEGAASVWRAVREEVEGAAETELTTSPTEDPWGVPL